MLHDAVKMVILHCTGTDKTEQHVDMVRSWHLARGFHDIGYHWLISNDASGSIQQGRAMNEMGAHCLGYNDCSIGVCLAGNHAFSEAQFASLRRLLKTLKEIYPEATLHAHNEFNANKTCPNLDLKAGWLAFWDSVNQAP